LIWDTIGQGGEPPTLLPGRYDASRHSFFAALKQHLAGHPCWKALETVESGFREYVDACHRAHAAVRRLAVQVEDHPIDYVDFAGEIPEGEYGAGIVEIWDKGEYELARQLPDKLEFTLRGARYSGDYALIHTRGNDWLLFKRKPSPHLP